DGRLGEEDRSRRPDRRLRRGRLYLQPRLQRDGTVLMRRTRWVALLLVASQLTLGVSCHNKIDGVGASSTGAAQGGLIAGILGSNDLGVALFNAYRKKLQAEPDPKIRAAKLGALDKRRADFIQAINDIVNA